MKITALAFMGLFFLLLFSEQAQANYILEEIWDDGKEMMRTTKSGSRYYLYSGESQIKVLVGNDNLGCSLRVGTKSSHTSLLKPSGPLEVHNTHDPFLFLKVRTNSIKERLDRLARFTFQCAASGNITVSSPPTVAVPVVMTLAYGPFLTKTLPALVIQKVAIKSVSASPVRRTYSLGQRVAINVNFSRPKLDGEDSPPVRWRMPQGKLCLPSEGSRSPISFGPIPKWQNSIRFGEDGPFYFVNKGIESVILCESGQTILEFGFTEYPMTDSTIKRLVFNVDKRAPLRSRGIETLPPLEIPDPEPPVLPNLELQGEKP